MRYRKTSNCHLYSSFSYVLTYYPCIAYINIKYVLVVRQFESLSTSAFFENLPPLMFTSFEHTFDYVYIHQKERIGHNMDSMTYPSCLQIFYRPLFCFRFDYLFNSIPSLFLFCRANNAKINFREKEKKVLDQILGQGKYDARIRPSGINGTGELYGKASYIIN